MFDETEDQASYGFEKLWAIAWRGRWWILLPLFLCWITVWGGSWLLPATYESEALILIEQQKVPEQYVMSNVTLGLQERLQSMTQQILSRTHLQSTIDRFHLYPPNHGLSRFLPSDDAVAQMRKDIKIELVETPTAGRPKELTAFRINYTARSPELAQQVNSELTSLFINESLKSQQQLSESTTGFLVNQLEEASKKLEEQEARVRAFKAQHLGDLPSQQQSNVGILSGLQVQVQNIQRALDGAKQQRLYLQSLLQQYQLAQTTLGGGDAGGSSLESLQRELLVLRNSLADERSRHTEDHPDIVRIKSKIAETEKLIKNLEGGMDSNQKAETPAGATSPGSASAASQIASTPLMQIRSQLQSNELEIQNYQRQEKTIESQISVYQARLNLTPATEQELADISRGYEESKTNYASLLQKQNQSQLATNLQERQQGEQFRILDPPSQPDKPKWPDHLRLSLGGLAVGGVLGIGLLVLRELTNSRVRHEEDLDGIVQARILVRIPHLDTPGEGSLRTVSRRREVAAALAMAIFMVVGNLLAFYKG
jgi:succinoglycan biosynthesis transport protein ExoP